MIKYTFLEIIFFLFYMLKHTIGTFEVGSHPLEKYNGVLLSHSVCH